MDNSCGLFSEFDPDAVCDPCVACDSCDGLNGSLESILSIGVW